MDIGAIGTLVPDLTPARDALAAARAFERAGLLLAPVGIPEDPAAPDVPGARDALREAIDRLRAVIDHAGGRPGTQHLELALDEATEALGHLTTPGIHPPIADVLDHTVRGEAFVQQALDLLDHPPAGWVGPV